MATRGELYGTSKIARVECRDATRLYWLCKKESANPAHCLAEGAGVRNCFDSL